MSEFTELNFRENHAYKYFDIYSAAENLGSEYFKNESEVFYEVKKEKFCHYLWQWLWFVHCLLAHREMFRQRMGRNVWMDHT